MFSKTMITAAVSALAGLFMMIGSPLDAETTASLSENLNSLLGTGMVVYGIVMGLLRKLTSSPLAGFFTKE